MTWLSASISVCQLVFSRQSDTSVYVKGFFFLIGEPLILSTCLIETNYHTNLETRCFRHTLVSQMSAEELEFVPGLFPPKAGIF